MHQDCQHHRQDRSCHTGARHPQRFLGLQLDRGGRLPAHACSRAMTACGPPPSGPQRQARAALSANGRGRG